MGKADIKMIHVSLDQIVGQREVLEEQVSMFDGVRVARFSNSRKHWLVVVYDSDSISSSTILNQVQLWDRDAFFF